MSESLNFSFKACEEPDQPQLDGISWNQMADPDVYREVSDEEIAGCAFAAVLEYHQLYPRDDDTLASYPQPPPIKLLDPT